MSRTFRHCQLAKRLGLHSVAKSIAERHGPWIEPTPKAVFVLQRAGMWPPTKDSDGDPAASKAQEQDGS